MLFHVLFVVHDTRGVHHFKIMNVCACSAPGDLVPNSINSCTNVTHPNTVSYTATVTIEPAFCIGKRPVEVLKPRVVFVGFGEVEVTVEVLCDCECSSEQVMCVCVRVCVSVCVCVCAHACV